MTNDERPKPESNPKHDARTISQRGGGYLFNPSSNCVARQHIAPAIVALSLFLHSGFELLSCLGAWVFRHSSQRVTQPDEYALVSLFPSSIPKILASRPMLGLVASMTDEEIEKALAEEEALERTNDKAYWKPLREELEQLRREKTKEGRDL